MVYVCIYTYIYEVPYVIAAGRRDRDRIKRACYSFGSIADGTSMVAGRSLDKLFDPRGSGFSLSQHLVLRQTEQRQRASCCFF